MTQHEEKCWDFISSLALQGPSDPRDPALLVLSGMLRPLNFLVTHPKEGLPSIPTTQIAATSTSSNGPRLSFSLLSFMQSPLYLAAPTIKVSA